MTHPWYLVISLPIIPYIHRIYTVLANPKYNRTSFNVSRSTPCGSPAEAIRAACSSRIFSCTSGRAAKTTKAAHDMPYDVSVAPSMFCVRVFVCMGVCTCVRMCACHRVCLYKCRMAHDMPHDVLVALSMFCVRMCVWVYIRVYVCVILCVGTYAGWPMMCRTMSQ
jgi:hypothetical protein